jgi:uncharacterized membrane protein YsdA (DUF1294 family)/cold shock CspA family protein
MVGRARVWITLIVRAGADGPKGPVVERGIVITFDPGRGYGFIRTRGRPEDVFVHISAVDGGRPLRAGQRVRFSAEPSERGPRAVRVEPGAVMLPPAEAAALLLGGLLAVATLGLHRLGWTWAAAWLVAVNAATMAVYILDKRRALRDCRRVPEWVLLALALVGGSPAAGLAMALLRHKTRKATFRVAFAAVVVLQVVGLAAWFWPR